MTLTVEAEEQPEVIQVRVPGEIPLNMDTEGNMTTADDLKVENLSTNLDVEVTGITVTGKYGWTIKDFDSDLSSLPEGTKELAMQFRGDGTQDGGSVPVTDGNWDIDHQSDLLLNVVAKMPTQGQEYVGTKTIAQVDYTVAVRDGEANIPVIDEEKLTTYYTFTDDPSTGGWRVGLTDGLRIALKTGGNFEDWKNGTALPAMPNTYNGKPITSMNGMFNSFNVMSLDLSNWDTSNVTDMGAMFKNCTPLATLDLSGWDVSNVTSMGNMFDSCSSLSLLWSHAGRLQ